MQKSKEQPTQRTFNRGLFSAPLFRGLSGFLFRDLKICHIARRMEVEGDDVLHGEIRHQGLGAGVGHRELALAFGTSQIPVCGDGGVFQLIQTRCAKRMLAWQRFRDPVAGIVKVQAQTARDDILHYRSELYWTYVLVSNISPIGL
jgi:hypothetical protein